MHRRPMADPGTGYTYVWSFEGNTLNEDAPEVTLIPPSSGTCVTVDDDYSATPPSTACAEVVLETPVSIAFSADTTEVMWNRGLLLHQ